MYIITKINESTSTEVPQKTLGFSFLLDDHYNPYLSSGEKVNPQRCLIYFYEPWEVEKEVVDILTSRHEGVKYILYRPSFSLISLFSPASCHVTW